MNTEQLKEFELLRYLNEQQLIMLANNSKLIKLIPDQILFSAGDTDHFHYFLLAGELQIDTGGSAPISLVAHSADAMAPIQHQRPRQYDVYARSGAAVLQIETSTLQALLREAPGDHYEVKKALREDQPEDKQLLLDIYSDLRNNKLVLPSLPEVAVRIRRMIDDGTNNAKKISQAVNTDPVVAAKLIKAANSPLFRGTKEFETSSQAIVRLGMQTTKQLVTSFTVKELFKTSTPVLKQRMDVLWQHSIEIAALSYVLAQNVKGLDPEQGLLAGLLHDIGVVPLLMYAHHYPNLMNNPQTLEKTIKDLKTELGPLILKRWGFNEEMVATATHSENWNYQHEGEPDFADLVIVAHLNQYMVSEEKLARINKIPAFRRLFPGENTAHQMTEILDQAKSQLEDTRQLLVA
ncbi:HDOD domain-containing protein [Ketobacter sp. MCCC 1A13808]|uniref:HDOD domain-containing protein n=1 Tax=Ketobacter sp. MCCC 1A13808 TaxID=2602738 RepID=UPI000F24714D|nr:HDOD domain-containing protein [Ketobacter sp. MCCC 1A13808]MVF10993.1 HDOD domain-containing protein [Ketobacter sp. MCCC 1A13808]RLP56381.1 MAG: HDOD domain-containing protein [Ketobacter sp.]